MNDDCTRSSNVSVETQLGWLNELQSILNEHGIPTLDALRARLAPERKAIQFYIPAGLSTDRAEDVETIQKAIQDGLRRLTVPPTDALAAGDVIAHQLLYRDHGAILERWWQARGGHAKCSVCSPETKSDPLRDPDPVYGLLQDIRSICYGSTVWEQVEELLEPILGQPKCDGQSCEHCDPEHGCKRAAQTKRESNE